MVKINKFLPNTHCSDRTLLPSGLLPLYFPMQIPAWRTLLQTVPPQSWISSTRFCVGGWECWDTNIGGWFWNRSCWCSPADKCLWRRQIWKKNTRAKFSSRLTSVFSSALHNKPPQNHYVLFLFLKEHLWHEWNATIWSINTVGGNIRLWKK